MNKAFHEPVALSRRMLKQAGVVLLGSAMLALPTAASALEKISYRTNWFPQAEHGGWYEAANAGIYAQYGLEVDQQPGGPQINNLQLLVSGRADFVMLHSSGQVLKAIEEDLPVVAVAAFYQKDPQAIMTHKGVGHDRLEDLKGQPILLSQDAHQSFWPWLKQKYGYTDDQVRPYTFQMGPFIADSGLSQQCYITSEPYAVRQADIDPNLFLLSDYGWQSYSTLIVTTTDTVKNKPELVERFVTASIDAWYQYLSDPSATNKVINQLNESQTEGQMANSLSEMRDRGILVSGDALENGIGSMNDARWKAASEQLKSIGLVKPDTDYTKAFTTRFIGTDTIKALVAKYPAVAASAAN
ncbi:ABC transporter substrate-binding protein [Halopseudomonas pelagia]|uniref:ABC transporter substrate-binding protein n=1 Tax=Halopseudomonas pelagia TaxID=553151 RepID=UPI0003B66DCD|nr:ABC transporter substrate-binding protein [Halopseudomonas pelagia]